MGEQSRLAHCFCGFLSWSGAQTLFWNCEASTVCCTPRGAMNWAIGIVGPKATSSFSPNEPLGWWESYGQHVTPRSFYYRQLQDRLGPQAVENVTLAGQRAGPIYDQLTRWAGVGRPADLLKSQWDGSAAAGIPVGPPAYNAPPCKTPIPGDLNGDCEVNEKDLEILTLDWLK